MKYRNILVTGGRGFIMFNGLKLWKAEYPEVNFICLDANTYADKFLQDEKNRILNELGIGRTEITLGTTGANVQLDWLIQKYNIDAIIHAAAESHVDNSIKDPNLFFNSNVLGTADILNIAKMHNIRVHVVSTDEVYGETMPGDWYMQHEGIAGETVCSCQIKPEDKVLKPSSPYSSSKASADLIALSYAQTYGMNVTVSRCTNNAGPYQHSEKMIGTTILKALKNEQIPVYGEGLQRRHWIDVDDHNAAIWKILHEGEAGKIYDIGPVKENWITNMELVKFILKTLGKSESLISHVKDRPGHDVSYFLPASEGMFSTKQYTEFMPKIIDWYVKKFENGEI